MIQWIDRSDVGPVQLSSAQQSVAARRDSRPRLLLPSSSNPPESTGRLFASNSIYECCDIDCLVKVSISNYRQKFDQETLETAYILSNKPVYIVEWASQVARCPWAGGGGGGG